MKLNLGCGADIREGFVNVDFVKADGVDVAHNLETFPYPFDDNTFEEVVANNILEHIRDLDGVMLELYRICKNNAIIKILVPHYNQLLAYTDPSHVRFFTPDTFNYYCYNMLGGRSFFVNNFGKKAKFKLKLVKLNRGFLGQFVPGFALRFLSYVIGEVVEAIYVEIEVEKMEAS